MSCNNTSFISGPEARIIARDSVTVFTEICAIQQAILAAISNCPGPGKYSTVVPLPVDPVPPATEITFEPVTPMTTTLDTSPVDGKPDSWMYFETFTGLLDSPEIEDQLAYVKSYFTALGYNIQIQVNPHTMNTIQWSIIW